MAVRNTVLSQSPEFRDIRLSAFQEAVTVYDLLAVATVRWGQTALLQEVSIPLYKFIHFLKISWLFFFIFLVFGTFYEVFI